MSQSLTVVTDAEIKKDPYCIYFVIIQLLDSFWSNIFQLFSNNFKCIWTIYLEDTITSLSYIIRFDDGNTACQKKDSQRLEDNNSL